MKNLTLLAFMVLFLSACQKEEIAPLITDSSDGITRLYVKVSFNDCYSGQSCDANNFVPLSDADVYLYENKEGMVVGESALMQGITDNAGTAKFENIESKKYVLAVDCPQGRSDREVYLEEGKTTRIDIRY